MNCNLKVLILFFLVIVTPTNANENGKSALFNAIESGDITAIKLALSDGANIEEEYHFGWKPIMKATFQKNIDAVQILLNAGASPNASDQLGESVLHISVGTPITISKALLSAGAKVNAKNAGSITPLMLAAGRGDTDLVKLLLSHGADAMLIDYESKTAIDWARRKGHHKIVSILNPTLAPNK